MKIVLASASPRRARLLRQINLSFTVDPSDIDEVVDPELSPVQLVESLAEQKGRSVMPAHPESLIIASDTIVCLNGDYLGKPESPNEARAMLLSMSRQTHEVYSGVWLAQTGPNAEPIHTVSFAEKTKVTFAALDEAEINRYIATGSPMDKAGSYGIQDDFGAVFVERIEGDYNNVVGFPLQAFYRTLKSEFPQLFKSLFNGS
jgi:septum formation protein